ncbi:hypothetical protein HDU67_008030, partial [Dinochytrium kinnereticum]
MTEDRTDENLSSYVRYLLDGSGAEHHVDFSQLRRDLDSNASSSLSFKSPVAHSTPANLSKFGKRSKNILSPDEYQDSRDEQSRFNTFDDAEIQRKRNVEQAPQRFTRAEAAESSQRDLGKTILTKATKRLLSLGFDALHPCLLGESSSSPLTYEQAFMMASALNNIMDVVEEQEVKIASLTRGPQKVEEHAKSNSRSTARNESRDGETLNSQDSVALQGAVLELSRTKESLRDKEMECRVLSAKLIEKEQKLSQYIAEQNASICDRFEVSDTQSLFATFDSIEIVLRALPPLESFVLKVDECVSTYSKDGIHIRPLDATLNILERWGRNSEFYASLRDFKSVMARELKCDTMDATEYFVKQIRMMERVSTAQDLHREERAIVDHFMKLFEITDIADIIPFINDVFVSWAETN